MSDVYGSNFANQSKSQGSESFSNAPAIQQKKQLIKTALSEGKKSGSASTGEYVSGAVGAVGLKLGGADKIVKSVISGSKGVKDARDGTSNLGKLLGRGGAEEGTEMAEVGSATADASAVATDAGVVGLEASGVALDASGILAPIGLALGAIGGIGAWYEAHKSGEAQAKSTASSEKAQAVDTTEKAVDQSQGVETADISASRVGQ